MWVGALYSKSFLLMLALRACFVGLVGDVEVAIPNGWKYGTQSMET